MKKPFKRTRVGKILTSGVVKAVITKLPFGIGSIASEMLNSTDTPEGEMNKEKMVHHLVKLAIYAALIYAVLSGKISWEDAESAKDLMSN